jgi:hypothetical protein
LDCDRYKNHIKSGWVKFVPDLLLPKFRPKIIEEVIRNDKTIGRVVGVNIKALDFSNSNEWQLFIDNIKSLKGKDDRNIYIEGMRKYPLKILKKISESTELIFCSGYNIRILNLPILLSKIYKSLGKELNSSDTLIISSEKSVVCDVIRVLSDMINFFSVYGMEDDQREEFYEEILESTGISIFQPKNMDKVIKNYGTIINFSNNIDIEKFDFRNQSVIIDFSDNKPLKVIQRKKKNILYIQDINLKSNVNSKWIGEYVDPELFVCIDGVENTFSQIYTNNHFYFIDDFVRNNLKKRIKI